MSEALETALNDLVIGNRILANEGVVDAFGHISVRHPDRPDRFFMACSRAPGLVTREDLVEFDLDCNPIDLRGKTPYIERPIHGASYQARPEVNSVVHNHAYEVIPFGIGDVKLSQVTQFGGGIGADVPVWDIAEHFGDTDFLVRTMDHGRDLARTLGERSCCLMACHGAMVVGPSVQDAVRLSIYLMVTARLLSDTLKISSKLRRLTEGEIRITREMTEGPHTMDRAWEYWARRAGFEVGAG